MGVQQCVAAMLPWPIGYMRNVPGHVSYVRRRTLEGKAAVALSARRQNVLDRGSASSEDGSFRVETKETVQSLVHMNVNLTHGLFTQH